ncbi:hypothetical protein B0H17DRAFT_1150806 [Mycena rosella]|uniref:Uncharacterized protein n=1 Tax=Mycena rosella TaxID=1033263 RepID=A0AAD7BQT6_MYCRO|nr:hypothetical protein B0H17DRAFT_1150806 [Mycena rosella]
MAPETHMVIATRWVPESEEWKAVAIMVGRGDYGRPGRYQHVLDELQGLIISRMFELTKMNMWETGYKLCKHIAKHREDRTEQLQPGCHPTMTPRAPMTWEQVVDYAFLSDFDLLHNGQDDIWEELWAKPAGRLAMDMYSKLERTTEEIKRLNLEIPRFLTYMRNEEAFLHREVVRICEEHGEALVHQVEQYRTTVNKEHLQGQQAVPAAGVPPASAADAATDNSDTDSEDEQDVLAQEFVLLSITED